MFVKRDFYLQQLVDSMWNGQVKVITGLRRCGKSVLLFEIFKDYLLREKVSVNNIIQLALDQRKNFQYRDPVVLCDYVGQIVKDNPRKKFYLFIDEVQLSVAVKYPKNEQIVITVYDMLNELRAYKNLDIYVTGSNSKLLSKDIATEFRGRSTQIHIQPLSFKEFYSVSKVSPQEALNQYLLYGGMPGLLICKTDLAKKKYLDGLYAELYVRDIMERNSLGKEDVLNGLLDYVSSQIGSLTNPNRIANALSTLRHEKVTPALISSYIRCAEDAFLITEARRYDIKGKAYFEYPNKYYYADTGLRNARLNYRQYDPGHLMENVVYNELIGCGYSVDVGVVVERHGNEKIIREIDFVVNSGDSRVYIQSAWQMDGAEKEGSELRPLQLTGDSFKKVVLRMDMPYSHYDEKGVYHCNLIDFLLGKVNLF